MAVTRKIRAARWGGALLVALAPLPWLGMGTAVATPGGEPGNSDKVTICHRTNSVTNPYVVITVDQSAVDGDLGNNTGQGDHYLEHLGPVFDPSVDYQPPFSDDEWGDIIPPIEGVHDGLNWTAEGIAIYQNDCTVPDTVTSSPPATTKPPTTKPPTTKPPTTSEPPTTSPPSDEKVTLCHRTNSVTNPYVLITVAVEAADGDAGNNNGQGDHYLEHNGPVFDANADYQPPFSGDEWGDIIPPIDGVHDGLNWTDEGIALYEDDCNAPSPSETPTPSETGSTPGSATPTSSSASPSSSSASPSETVTTTITDSPSEDDVDKPTKDESPEATESETSAGALPQTGSGVPWAGAVGISLLLIGIGALLLLGPGRLIPASYHRKH
ncbi:MAG: hypothetical protein ABI720_01485 [Actinomycetes bacterium]